jgi:TetR/AcrR family transcriptional repressor of nem operon
MRKSRSEAAETRQRIVRTASGVFRREGLGTPALDDLMAEAGLTRGGFYRHFASRDHLVAESLTVAFDGLIASMTAAIDERGERSPMEVASELYLNEAHRDGPAEGCPLAALGSELARASESVRDVATDGLRRMIETIAAGDEFEPEADAREQALVSLSTMIGALSMARMVTDPDLSSALLTRVNAHLARMAGVTVPGDGHDSRTAGSPGE